MRAGFLMNLCHSFGLLASDEQPGGFVLHYLWLFQRMLKPGSLNPPGFFNARFCDCSFGSPFQKARKLMSNMPALASFPSGCSCMYSGRHFTAQGSFTAPLLKDFLARCVPNVESVYDRAPHFRVPHSQVLIHYPL